MVSSAVIVIAGVVAVGIAGAAALAVGVRGRRIDDHPVCRGCGFDLVGAQPGAEVCSECGRSLDRRRAVRIGRRRKRRGLIGVGLALLALVLGLAGTIGWGAASGFNWNTVKPAWMLLGDVRGASGPAADAALAELDTRLREDRLGEGAARELVAIALDLQEASGRGAGAPAWRSGLGDVVLAARAKGLVSDERWRRFVRQGVVIELSARRRVGEVLPTEIDVSSRMGGGFPRMHVELDWLELTVDGRPAGTDAARLPSMRSMVPGPHARTTMGYVVPLPAWVDPGARTLRLRLRAAVSERAGGEPLVVREWTEEVVLDVAGPGEAVVGIVEPDAELRRALASCVEARLDRTGRRGDRLFVQFNQPPVSVAGRVLLRRGGEEVELGSLEVHGPSEVGQGTYLNLDEGVEVAGAAIVIVPDEAVARKTVEIEEMWGEEIVIEEIRMPEASDAAAPDDGG